MSEDFGDRISKIIEEKEKSSTTSQTSAGQNEKAAAMPNYPTEAPIQSLNRVNKTVVALALIFAVACLSGYYLWTFSASSNRFALTTTPQGQAYQIDTTTGEAWILAGKRKIPVEKEKTEGDRKILTGQGKPSDSSEQPLPADEIGKLTGNGQISNEVGDPGRFKGSIYNGSSWTVTKLVLKLTAKDVNKEVRWSRDFSVAVYFPPLTTSPFSIPLAGERGIQDCPWQIVGVYGRPN